METRQDIEGGEHHRQGGSHGGGGVGEVTIDGKPKNIKLGRYLVLDLKSQLGIPPDYELDRVVNGEFKPLDDKDHVVIHGGEIFVSHVRRGGRLESVGRKSRGSPGDLSRGPRFFRSSEGLCSPSETQGHGWRERT